MAATAARLRAGPVRVVSHAAWRPRSPAPAPAPGVATSLPFDRKHPVVAFLRDIGLPQYAESLLRSGFDDMDTLLEIEDVDMRDLGMPLHHVVKLRNRVQDLRRQKAGAGCTVDEENPVAAFLREVGLGQHARVLVQNGFDDMETLLEISDEDLRDLGIPRGHAVKLRKRMGAWLQGQTQQTGATQLAVQMPMPGQALRPLGPAPSALAAPTPTESMHSAVQRSWEELQHLGIAAVGELLYRHCFELAPGAVELFPPEVRHKYRDWSADELTDESDVHDSPALRKLFGKILNAVGSAVAGAHEPAQRVPMLKQLGCRHIHYGVCEAHWQVLGEALKLTLRDCLGPNFTPEVEHAWATVYGFISAIMIEGLRSAQPPTKAACVASADSSIATTRFSSSASSGTGDVAGEELAQETTTLSGL